MKKNKLKIVGVASEVTPFSKSGGLGQVVRSMFKAIKRLGHDVTIITPLYGRVINKEKHKLKLIYKNIKIRLNSDETEIVNFWRGYLMNGLPVYFVENTKFFSKRKELYLSNRENARFLIFSVASLKLIQLLNLKPDIIHCHDRQAGLVPFYLKTKFRYAKGLEKTKTVFTLHNLIFQMGKNWWEIPVEERDNGRKKIPHISNSEIENINFTKRGILSADILNAVSKQYRNEIISNRSSGQDLNKILKNRKDRLFGIVNGIDYNSYNPAKDDRIAYNYNYRNFQKNKAKNKTELQKMLNLPVRKDVPVICMVTRISEQKGFDLIFDTIPGLMTLDIQIALMGGADEYYYKKIKKLMKKYPTKIGAHLKFSQRQGPKLFAGANMTLVPSRVEPCGIIQLEAMRYGTIPIVRHTGGLVDTVKDYNIKTKKGTGFVFKNYKSYELLIAVTRAVELYKNKKKWNELVRKVMLKTNSWELPAKEYVKLYEKALKLKNGNGKNTK